MRRRLSQWFLFFARGARCDTDTGTAKIYIYASRLQARWLGDMIEQNPHVKDVPFEKLALAGSHDAGMIGR